MTPPSSDGRSLQSREAFRLRYPRFNRQIFASNSMNGMEDSVLVGEDRPVWMRPTLFMKRILSWAESLVLVCFIIKGSMIMSATFSTRHVAASRKFPSTKRMVFAAIPRVSAVFGHEEFVGLQTGPTSSGRGWLLRVIVSVTPYTYDEDFSGPDTVLSSDSLKIAFRVHLVWRVRPDRVKQFME